MKQETRDADLEFARQTYLELIEKSKQTAEVLSSLLTESESPRIAEVLAGTIKTASEITDRLVEVHKSKKELDKKDNVKQQQEQLPGNVNNNLFIGSTEELQRLLNGKTSVSNEKVLQ